MSVPEELARRGKRLAKLAEARATIEARAKERHAREQAEHDAKLAARTAKTTTTGKKPGGKPPAPPVEGPGRPTGQPDRRGLAHHEGGGGSFEQCYNAQAMVETDSLLVVAPMWRRRPTTSSSWSRWWASSRHAEELGKAETLLADTGYFSEANVQACVAAEWIR